MLKIIRELLTGRGILVPFKSPSHSSNVRVDCYGMAGEEMNKFIDIAPEFHCRLYDPQVGVCYDGA